MVKYCRYVHREKYLPGKGCAPVEEGGRMWVCEPTAHTHIYFFEEKFQIRIPGSSSSKCKCGILHCKEPIPEIRNKYSQKRNCAATVTISTCMCLWAIYIFPQWICLFCCRKYVDRSWEYINRSQTHECVNWDWGRAIRRKELHKWNFRCSVIVGPNPNSIVQNNASSKNMFDWTPGLHWECGYKFRTQQLKWIPKHPSRSESETLR
jgi:hypothetical protein